MAFELIKDNFIVNDKSSDGCTQIVLEKDIIVPDTKPDIFDVIRVCGRISKIFSNALNKRIDYKSKLYLTVIYQAKSDEKPINSINTDFPFEDFISFDELENDTYHKITAKIDSIEYRLINDRKINVKVIIDVCYKTERPIEIEYIKDAKGNIELLKNKITLMKNGIRKNDTINVKNEASLPSSKSDIFQIIHSDAVICDKEVKALDGKVMVKGNVCFSILYSGIDNDSVLEIFETEVPFSGFIELPESKEGMTVSENFTITDLSAKPMQDDDKEDRMFDLECEIDADVTLLENEETELISDIYDLKNDISLSEQKINYNKFLCKNKNKNIIKKELLLPPKYPDIISVLKVTADSKLLGYEFENNILTCIGEIQADIYYISNSDSKPVCLAKFIFDFEENLDVKGAYENTDIEVKTETEDISFNLLSEREIELKVTVVTDVYVEAKNECNIISSVTAMAKPKEFFTGLAGAVIYTVQKGDTLWKIAKKYNTTVGNILMYNDIDNPNLIYPGEKILIIKKCVCKE